MKALLAAAALAALAPAAGAATLTIDVAPAGDGQYYGTGSATTREDVTFAFLLPVAFRDVSVAISGSGTLRNASLTYSVPGAAPVAITSPFAHIFAVGALAPGLYEVRYDFTGLPAVPVSLTATMFATPFAVPLPAAGGLAAAGLGTLLALRTRRRDAA